MGSPRGSKKPDPISAILAIVFWTKLRTPAALVALDRLESNTSRMSERMGRLGVRLRPHVKTHKCVEAARFQVRGHFGGITVSTLEEARFFGDAGFRDITYAVPIAADRIEQAVDLQRSLDRLSLLVDHPDAADLVEQVANAKKVPISLFLKVDCGYHRAGVDPDDDASVRLAMRLDASPSIDFRGILTHAGHSYDAGSPDEIREVGRTERSVMVSFAEKLRDAGARVLEVSVGSTPTMSLAESLEGITEARPGNYAFYDRFQAMVGSCSMDDVAFSVLASVLSHYPQHNKLLIDAGALAFSKDPGATHVDPNCGFGAIQSEDGQHSFDDLRLDALSQEHGKIVGTAGPIDYDRFPVGSKLRIVPNHSCLSAALFDRYHVYRGEELVDEWRPTRGW